LFWYRSILVVVVAASLLAGLAAASAPFVATAAASEALKNKLAELSPNATGLELESSWLLGRHNVGGALSARERFDTTSRGLAARLQVRPPLLTTETSAVYVSGPHGTSDVRLMARTGALAHVRVLQQSGGDGVWIPDITAHAIGARPGDMLRVGGATFGAANSVELRVRGIYRALAHSPESDYWSNLFQEIYPECLDCDVPTPYLLMSPRALYGLLASFRGQRGHVQSFGGSTGVITRLAELPVDPTHLTLADARSLERSFDAVGKGLQHTPLGAGLGCSRPTSVVACKAISSLSAAVILADRNASAVTPAVTLLADLGTGVALAIAAAAGVFLVRRRRAEAALLYARGEHVGVFAARSALEAALPTLAGGAVGFGLAYALTDVFAPSGSISSVTVWSGAAHAAVAVAAAVALLVAGAAVSFLHLYDTGVRGARRPRRLPWEAVLLAAALVLYLRIRSGGAVTHGAAHAPTLAVFVFPLVLVAAVAGLGARLARLALGLGSSHARGRRPPVYLALRRLADARGLVVLLAVVAAASLGAFFYVETLASSLHHTTVEKAYTATGSDAYAIVQDSQQLPRDFGYPITRVQFANQAASTVDGSPVDVMLVDPATLSRTLHWQSDWGPSPAGLVDDLARAPSAPLPVIVTPDLAGSKALLIGGVRVPTHVLASVRAFPFMAEGTPLAITSYDALDEFEARTKAFDSLGVLSTYVWGKGPPAQVSRALTALEPTYPPATIETYLRAPDVVLATRTFTFMRMIAIGVGVLALLGLLLYLQSRQRSQAIASALARRMGLTRAAETLSLCLEVAAILAFAAVLGGGVAIASAAPVVRRIDPLPQDPPSPIFTVPVGEIVLTALALVVFAVAAGALTSWFARRTDVSEALRVG
jgi:putative ABC transport system permease protein